MINLYNSSTMMLHEKSYFKRFYYGSEFICLGFLGMTIRTFEPMNLRTLSLQEV